MDLDKELSAMQKIVAALSDLAEDERSRVIQWAANRFSVVLDGRRPSAKHLQTETPEHIEKPEGGFDEFATLFSSVDPKSGPEKALAAAYWHQICLGKETVGSMDINNELKHLGHGIGNITDALSALIRRKPSLVLQVRKSGKTKQARKKYKLTTAGIGKVKDMLSYSENGG